MALVNFFDVRAIRCSLVLLAALASTVACGGEGSDATLTDGGASGTTGGTGGDVVFNLGGQAGNGASAGAAQTGPCATADCSVGQRCELSDGVAQCIDNSCEELDCALTEACQPAAGGGHVCIDRSCTTDVDCMPGEHCGEQGTCLEDACVPGAKRCVGQEVEVCSANGSGYAAHFTCEGSTFFASQCIDDGAGDAGCSCAGNWDCPEHTECQAGLCRGSGQEATCTLPPTPFGEVLPAEEFRWGSDGGAQTSPTDGTGAPVPFPEYRQVTGTPVVANLDDDNGDGLINELDFPEIIFMSYLNGTHPACNSSNGCPHTTGILRAVHAGGPNKGKDYFALCNETHWLEGEDTSKSCAGTGHFNQSGALAVGNLDGRGGPEIVLPTQERGLVLTNSRGEILDQTGAGAYALTDNPHGGFTIALHNLDGEGLPEVIVGRTVFGLRQDPDGKLRFGDKFVGTGQEGTHGYFGPFACVADLAGGSELEIVAGTSAYRLPAPPSGSVSQQSDCASGDTSDFCQGRLELVWDGQTVNGSGSIPDAHNDGFCAIADVLGADEVAAPGPQNLPDQKPEVIVIANGHLVILNGESGVLRRFIDLEGGADGGAPNVDDFDGDGFMEIATALANFYVMYDLQEPTSGDASACQAWSATLDESTAPPQGNPARNPGPASCTNDTQCNDGAVCSPTVGRCVCLHNGWQRDTEDNSSKATASSVFDFNGDGAAEAVYNDECFFRVYDGTTSQVYIQKPSLTRTAIEHPVVADVDNDGNAEIVIVNNNFKKQCGKGNVTSGYGLVVLGDPSDSWVSARRVWNQTSYSVTNTTEAAAIPALQPPHWKPLNGRYYNTYRSQPRSFGVAPDLTVTGVRVSSPGAGCGVLSTSIDIIFQLANAGDLRVGPGVQLSFYGTWDGTEKPLFADEARTEVLSLTLEQSLEPGAETILSVPYEAAFSQEGQLPDEVRVIVDEDTGGGIGAARECNEDNNAAIAAVDAGEELADLRLVIDAVSDNTCPTPTARATLYNIGSLPAEGIGVRFFAGDPSLGGKFLAEQTVAGPLAAGRSTAVELRLSDFPQQRDVTVWGVADPDDTIAECDEANNRDSAEQPVRCGTLIY